MKNTLIYSVVFTAILCLVSCNKDIIRPSGKIITKQIEIASFSEIEVDHGIYVHITDDQVEGTAKIKTDDNVYEHLEIFNNDNTLVLRINYDVQLSTDCLIEVWVNPSRFSSVDGSAGSRTMYTGILAIDKLSIELSSGAEFIGEVDVDTIDAEISGGSRIYLKGSCEDFNLVSSGGSISEGFDFIVTNSKINISGGGNIEQTIIGTLSIVASGGSTLHYKGNPNIVKKELSGGSYIVNEDGE